MQQVFIDSKCIAHQNFIAESLPSYWYKKAIIGLEIRKLSGQACVNLIGVDGDDPMSSPENPNLVLAKRRVGKQLVGHGKILNRYRVNIREIQRWKNTCDQKHRNGCLQQPSFRLPPGSPDWLIDTRRECLVPAQPGLSYFALSYVWGGD
jgi:hypothetical protein